MSMAYWLMSRVTEDSKLEMAVQNKEEKSYNFNYKNFTVSY